MNNIIRLVVVDDHSLFRRGLVGLLEEMAGFQVVGQAGDGVQALPLIEQVQPDIVLLDLNMPNLDGIATLRELRARRNPVRVLMLTISQNDTDLLDAIRAGADGYLLKNTEPEDLRNALQRVAEGQGALSPEVTAPVLRAVTRFGANEAGALLSDRELDVLGCLVDGLTTIQIAGRLFISENTVKTHVRHIFEKLEVSNRAE
ncbi:MAG: response regulator transcription factor, partial [Anaerolineaceae bacterium]|nr:response regulator transcription factor [Anaerolineaceae bacterium]